MQTGPCLIAGPSATLHPGLGMFALRGRIGVADGGASDAGSIESFPVTLDSEEFADAPGFAILNSPRDNNAWQFPVDRALRKCHHFCWWFPRDVKREHGAAYPSGTKTVAAPATVSGEDLRTKPLEA